MQTIVKTNQLTKTYDNKFALQNVDISIHEGDIYGIVGKSEAGKTTLLKLIMGLTQTTSGTISLFNSNDLAAQRQKIGAMIEGPSFVSYLTAEQNLEYFRIHKGVVEKDVISDVLEITELYEDRKTIYHKLPIGLKQRLGLALSLLGEPDLLLLDEPANGVDHSGIAQIRRILKRLNLERRITMIITSHLLTELSLVATRFAVLDRGILLEEFTGAELERQTRSSIRIESDNTSRVAMILEEKFGMTEFSIDGDHHVLLYQGFDRIPAITNALVLGGISIWGIHKQRTELETFFLQKIGDTDG